MVSGPASFFDAILMLEGRGKVLGSGGCNSWSGQVAGDG